MFEALRGRSKGACSSFIWLISIFQISTQQLPSVRSFLWSPLHPSTQPPPPLLPPPPLPLPLTATTTTAQSTYVTLRMSPMRLSHTIFNGFWLFSLQTYFSFWCQGLLLFFLSHSHPSAIFQKHSFSAWASLPAGLDLWALQWPCHGVTRLGWKVRWPLPLTQICRLKFQAMWGKWILTRVPF